MFAQISPGELSNAHSDLEGISNCTKCHDLGKSVSKAKCLDCHSEITDLMNQERGFHSSSEVLSKDCWSCHGEHFGRTFQIVRFDKDGFDHNKSGFELKGKHKEIKCEDCHNSKHILVEKLKKKNSTFLGLGNQCKNCHEDIHQGTLSEKCSNCHTEEKFKPALKFNHENTKFKLTGSHINVDCLKCHIKEERNSKPFQKFAGVKFNSCNNCHEDFHKGKFGNDCASCHNPNSFKEVNILSGFDHNKTNFPLIGKHNLVKCENCHKGSLTNKPKFQKCYDCHEDFHKGEFVKNNLQTDCKSCHNEQGFSPSTFTLEKHSETKFQLANAHSAIPCFSCHLKETEWKFRISSEKCIVCHENIHANKISAEFFDENKCESCHSTIAWQNVEFDHNRTEFKLAGKHTDASCSDCHFVFEGEKIQNQRFAELNLNCTQCHKDIHLGQFIEEGLELCNECHTSENWQPILFDHSETRFPLDGAHNKVDCSKCHKTITDGEVQYINYKIEDVTCKSCHS
ncbi:MAG: cytochrome C [Ignavibacteriales bacterium]|nr:cytochrome C [Ignavibacteriales bacterium]